MSTDLRVGVVARATNRGLGIQTMEAARALDASVLVVDVPSSPAAGEHPTIVDRYPGAPVVTCRQGWRLDEAPVRDWLDDVDVVYTAETFYDERFCDWARDQHVATVVHANPEFTPASGRGWGIGSPTAWWSATSWRREHMPHGTTVVPFPVTSLAPVEPHGRPCRWLHVAGKAAIADRNGTDIVLAALELLEEPCSVRIVSQDPALSRSWVAVPWHVELEVVTGGVDSHHDLYADVDALIMPRRYGGLCLPVQEAMGRGLAVAMTDVNPNLATWPILPIPAAGERRLHVPAGEIPFADIDPAAVAHAMDSFANPPGRCWYQHQSRAWAGDHTWDTFRPRWLDLFEQLAARAP